MLNYGHGLAADPVTAVTRRSVRAASRAAESGVTPLEVGVDVRGARRLLWAGMGVTVALDVVASVGAAVGAPYSITRFFDGDYKANFPTGYKIFFLFGVTVLFAMLVQIARRDGDRFVRGWLLLASVAGFACLDETVYLHQSLSEVIHHSFHTSGVLKFAWTIVYLPAVLAVFVILLRYLRYLRSALRWQLLVSGILYGGGALLFEPVKSHLSDSSGEGSLAFKLVAAVSDSCEMVGLTILAVLLLTEIARRVGAVAVVLAPDPVE